MLSRFALRATASAADGGDAWRSGSAPRRKVEARAHDTVTLCGAARRQPLSAQPGERSGRAPHLPRPLGATERSVGVLPGFGYCGTPLERMCRKGAHGSAHELRATGRWKNGVLYGARGRHVRPRQLVFVLPLVDGHDVRRLVLLMSRRLLHVWV